MIHISFFSSFSFHFLPLFLFRMPQTGSSPVCGLLFCTYVKNRRTAQGSSPVRLSKKSGTVKISQQIINVLWSRNDCESQANFEHFIVKNSLLRKDFDLHHNSRPTVPSYADGRELLVFRTFLQSASVSKKVFWHVEGAVLAGGSPVFALKWNSAFGRVKDAARERALPGKMNTEDWTMNNCGVAPRRISSFSFWKPFHIPAKPIDFVIARPWNGRGNL